VVAAEETVSIVVSLAIGVKSAPVEVEDEEKEEEEVEEEVGRVVEKESVTLVGNQAIGPKNVQLVEAMGEVDNALEQILMEEA